MKNIGIFWQVFLYTLTALISVVLAILVIFAQQFVSFYRTIELEQVKVVYQPLTKILQSDVTFDVVEVANQFHQNNQSLVFYIRDVNQDIVYQTEGADTSEQFQGDFLYVITNETNADYVLIAQSKGLEAFYQLLSTNGMIAILAIITICIALAYFFARQMSRPIRMLAQATQKMSRRESLQLPPARGDELGQLTSDVYSMYLTLEETIGELEREIIRTKAMEQTQRDFFTAASHELKTPIAATSVLLEGMLANIGDYQNHPKYLAECLKLQDAQANVVGEIFELVKLEEGSVAVTSERVDMSTMIQQLSQDMHILSSNVDVNFSCELPVTMFVQTDRQLSKKILTNIILNAIQNTPRGENVRISANETQSHWRITVENTGVQLPPEVLSRVYEPFYRQDQARSRIQGRSGLGLSIVAKIAKLLELNYCLENTKTGICFWFELPKVTGKGEA